MDQSRRGRLMALVLLSAIGCAEHPAAPGAAIEGAGPSAAVASSEPAGDGLETIEPSRALEASDAHSDCRGETVEEVATLGWREIQSPEGDVVARAEQLTLTLDARLTHGVGARLYLTARADGAEREISLGTLVATPGHAADLPLSLASTGLDLAALEHPAQVIVEARLFDVGSGGSLGSLHSPALFLLLDTSGAPVAATETALRTRFAAGASLRQRQQGVDPTVFGYGRGRMARSEDLHGDPADVAIAMEGGE